MSRQEVGVEVGLDHMGDLHSVLARLGEVGRDVTLRVHHHGSTRTGVAHEVRRVRKTRQIVLLQMKGHG